MHRHHSSIKAQEPWLELGEAARFLGIHFTTLRRWADTGKIPCIRTPGGRRRFLVSDLEKFLTSQRSIPAQTAQLPLELASLQQTRKGVETLQSRPGPWYTHLGDQQRMLFRYTGQRLLGLLIQYTSRVEGSEVYLEESRRMARDYGEICFRAGLSLVETIQAFLFFRKNYLETIHNTGRLGGPNDQEGLRLYQRTTDFFDTILVETVESFSGLENPGKSAIQEKDPTR